MYLHDRSQFARLNGTSSRELVINSGVPKGSVLGPLLFILYINNIADKISSHPCTPFIYADDMHLFSKNNLISNLEVDINSTLEPFGLCLTTSLLMWKNVNIWFSNRRDV